MLSPVEHALFRCLQVIKKIKFWRNMFSGVPRMFVHKTEDGIEVVDTLRPTLAGFAQDAPRYTNV